MTEIRIAAPYWRRIEDAVRKITAQESQALQRGFILAHSPYDPNTTRIYDKTGRLRGLVTHRDGVMTYGEFDGRVYAIWPSDSAHKHSQVRQRMTIRIAQATP